MSRPIAVLRPVPGNAATLARLADAGLAAFAVPLFAVRRLPWTPPTDDVDAVLFTSANAVRHGGDRLADMSSLPAIAVGAATAAAARAAGFVVAVTGARDAASAIADAKAAGYVRLLHVRGHDVIPCADPAIIATATVYASEPLPVPAADVARLAGSVTLIHSPRAARRLGELLADEARDRIRIAALSPAVRAAAGTGWNAVVVAARPTDACLIAAAATLAD